MLNKSGCAHSLCSVYRTSALINGRLSSAVKEEKEKQQLLLGKQRSGDQHCWEHPKAGMKLVFERKAGVYTTTSKRRGSSDKLGR